VIYRSNGYLGSKLSLAGFVVNPSPVARYRVAESVICAFAAGNGHLEVLRWAREHDCPWSTLTCAYAAEGGHLEVLKWAVEHDCPWGSMTCTYAAEGGHLQLLKWARGHGCPWQAKCCAQFADARGHEEMAQWVRAQPDYDEDELVSQEL
jgi:hypothetical protein